MNFTPSYSELVDYMKKLRKHFQTNYPIDFKCGTLYQGHEDFTYFALTTLHSKPLKLKYVIILNLKELRFEICLSGQNKAIRKEYWNYFKGSDWQKYHLVESIDESLAIIDTTLIEVANFSNLHQLTIDIEKEAIQFINAIDPFFEV